MINKVTFPYFYTTKLSYSESSSKSLISILSQKLSLWASYLHEGFSFSRGMVKLLNSMLKFIELIFL